MRMHRHKQPARQELAKLLLVKLIGGLRNYMLYPAAASAGSETSRTEEGQQVGGLNTLNQHTKV